MSYQFIILGIGAAAALYYYFSGHRPLRYGDGRSWDHEAKYEEKEGACIFCFEVIKPHEVYRYTLGVVFRQHIERICPICRQPFFKISSQQ